MVVFLIINRLARGNRHAPAHTTLGEVRDAHKSVSFSHHACEKFEAGGNSKQVGL